MFDAHALYDALDVQRVERELSWTGVARELWEMSAEPLPSAGPDRRLRRHLHATPRRDLPGVYEALDERRRERELTWPALARELRCGPSQLTGLRQARFAVGMTLAMAITQWLSRPAADFVYAARW